MHTHLWSTDAIGGMAARWAGVPISIATVHGGYFERIDERGLVALRKTCLSWTFRCTYALFDRVVTVSEQIAADLASRPGVRVGRLKISVVPNGTDLPDLAAASIASRAALGLPDSGRLVTTVANFAPMKGHRHLVAAMPQVVARHPDVRFLFAGAGRALDSIRQLVTEAGLDDHVRFLGARTDGVAIMAHSDLVVLPSVASEGIPISLIEALALARPIVATRVGGIPEIVEHGSTGVLVAPGDPQALADAVNGVLANEAPAMAMAARGRTVALERLTGNRMAREIERVYGELLDTPEFSAASQRAAP